LCVRFRTIRIVLAEDRHRYESPGGKQVNVGKNFDTLLTESKQGFLLPENNKRKESEP
jgi:hypothetical protein